MTNKFPPAQTTAVDGTVHSAAGTPVPALLKPKPTSRRWWWLLAVAALAAGGWWWHSHQQPAPGTGEGGAATGAGGGGGGRRGAGGPNAARVQPVTVVAAEKRDIRVSVNAIGSIAAANTAVVRTRVDGELQAVHFTEGQPVKAGQLLAQIDPRPFQIAQAQAQGQLVRDQALLRNAQLDAQRYRDLVAKDAAPKQQVDTQESLVQQLQGTVQSDQAALDNAKLQLSYTRIVAPISGLVGLKQADLGNVLHASDANGLLSIVQMQPAALVFAVPDVQLARIRQQIKAGAALPVEAWDREQKVMLAKGQVASTDNAIDTTTGTIRVKALFPNADNSLFPNQFVNVRMQLDVLAGAISVPSAAVQRGSAGNMVYVVGEDNKASMRRVTPLATDNEWVAVQGDIKPGERVVTDGTDRLREGAKVEIIQPGKAGSGGGGGGGHDGKRRRNGGASAAAASAAAPTPAAAGAAASAAEASAASTASAANAASSAAAEPAAAQASASHRHAARAQ